jgi:hypothetical protein
MEKYAANLPQSLFAKEGRYINVILNSDRKSVV